MNSGRRQSGGGATSGINVPDLYYAPRPGSTLSPAAGGVLAAFGVLRRESSRPRAISKGLNAIESAVICGNQPIRRPAQRYSALLGIIFISSSIRSGG